MADIVDELSNKCAVLLSEEPKIESAIKNLVSVLLANNLTNGSDIQRQDAMTPSLLIGCAKKVVQYINSIQLVDVIDWGVAHPQKEAETASDRIDSITNYKVARLMWNKARTKSTKICKVFGLNMLLWTQMAEDMFNSLVLNNEDYVYTHVESSVMATPKQANDPPLQFLAEFVYCFIKTIHSVANSTSSLTTTSLPQMPELESLVPNSTDKCYGDIERSFEKYSDLCWCSNFAAELQKRQAARRAAIEERDEAVLASAATAVAEAESETEPARDV